ncbi:MAG: hypothetical protein KJ957_01230, partial [Candidatus Omnitrophica bacterium]|nr:hypothetical protein [Candidatus Omnitrophota bacterium]
MLKNPLIYAVTALFIFLSLILPAILLADVEITSPEEGETVGGIVPISLTYTGTEDLPVYYLYCSLVGGYWVIPSALSGSHTFYWDTTYAPNGTQQTVQVYANWAGDPNGAYDTVTVTVNNPPPEITITSPINDETIPPDASPLAVSVEFHNVQPNYHGIKWIALEIDGMYAGGLYVPGYPESGTYTWDIDISNWPLGEHTLRAYCEDTSSKWSYSEEVKINIGEIAPPVDPTKEVPEDKVTTVAEPINVANGNMFTSHTDIRIQSREVPLELSRTYNSQDDFEGQFGYGWRSNYDITLEEQPDESVIEVDEKGVYTVYTKNPDGIYTASRGKYSELTKNLDGSYTILRKHGRRDYFNPQGQLIKIEGRNNNFISITRDAIGIIQEVIGPSGRELLFTKDSQDRIVEVKDPDGRTFKYEYDTEGNLIKTIDPLNNETLYQYDSNHNLIRQIDANNYSIYYEYDSEDRACHSWQDNNNNGVTLSFDPSNNTTTSTDSLGRVTS